VFVDTVGCYYVDEIQYGRYKFEKIQETNYQQTTEKLRKHKLGAKLGKYIEGEGELKTQKIKSKKEKVSLYESNITYYGGNVLSKSWEEDESKFSHFKMRFKRTSNLLENEDEAKLVENEIQKREYIYKVALIPIIFKEICIPIRILLMGKSGAGKSSVTNLFLNCFQDKNDITEINTWFTPSPVGNTEGKTFTTSVISYHISDKVSVYDFVGFDIFMDRKDKLNFALKKVTNGEFPTNTTLKKNFFTKKEKQHNPPPDIIFIVVDTNEVLDYEKEKLKYIVDQLKNFKIRCFILFNKMDLFNTDRNFYVSGLQKEDLCNENFDLQSFRFHVNQDLIDGDDYIEDCLHYNELFNSYNNFKIWCVNQEWAYENESTDLMIKEARKILYSSVANYTN